MSKRSSPLEGQEQLFVGGGKEYSAGYHTWQQVEETPNLKFAYAPLDPDALAVDIETRARLLTQILTNLGKISQRVEGFPVAAEVRPHSQEIWGRYRGQTPEVIEGAQRNADDLFEKVKRDFWEATGFVAVRNSGLLSRNEADARAKQDWNNFQGRFYGAANNDRRQLRKRKLSKQITSQKKLKKQVKPTEQRAA